MLRSLLCVPLLVALALFALSARAEDDASIEDVVLLTDGSFVRGTLVEYAAGEYAVLLTRAGDIREMNTLYAAAFPAAHLPARTTCVVAALPVPEFLLEIECIAALD